MRARDLLALSAGNLRRMRLRTFLTVSGVVIAIAAFTAMVSFGAGNQKYMTAQFESLGLFNTMQVLPPAAKAAGDTAAAAPLDERALERLARIPGVRLAYPYDAIAVSATVAGRAAQSSLQALPAAAIRTRLFSQLRAGRVFAADDAKEAVVTSAFLRSVGIQSPDSAIGRELVLSVRAAVVDSGLAALLPRDPSEIRELARGVDIDSLVEGDYRNRVARRFVNLGITRFLGGFFGRRLVVADTLRIAGVLEEAGGQARPEPIVAPLATARRFRSRGLSDNPADLFAAMSSGSIVSLDAAAGGKAYPKITLDLDPAAPLQAVKDSVAALGYRTFSFADQFAEMRKAFLLFNLFLGIVGFIALVTASLGIVNTMVMSIVERRREIGVLKSLGAAESDIRLLFIAESGAIGALGSAIGVVAGWLVTRVASFAVRQIMERQGVGSVELFAMPYWLVLIALALGIVVSMAAGSFPAARAAAVDPVEALRNE